MAKVLSISNDKKILVEGSAVRERMKEYGTLFEELHIIVFSKKNLKFQIPNFKISDNVFVYPTNSFFKFFYMKNATAIAKKIIKDENLTPSDTVVTVQDPFETGLVGERLQSMGFKLHVQVHTDIFSPYFSSLSALHKIRVKMSRRILAKADAVRTVSKKVKESVEKEVKLKTTPSILPIFVDVSKFENAPVTIDLKRKYSQFNFILLIASRLTDEKNIPMALSVVKRLTPAYKRLGLVIVGEGPEKHNLEKRIKELGISDNVVFEPWANDLASYYKTANLFLVPSWYEGFGMTIIEAAASHCPVIATDVGIAGEILHDGDTTSICPVGDEDCFYTKTRELIENNGLREKMVHEVFERLPRVVNIDKKEYLTRYKDDITRALSTHEK